MTNYTPTVEALAAAHAELEGVRAVHLSGEETERLAAIRTELRLLEERIQAKANGDEVPQHDGDATLSIVSMDGDDSSRWDFGDRKAGVDGDDEAESGVDRVPAAEAGDVDGESEGDSATDADGEDSEGATTEGVDVVPSGVSEDE